MCTFRVVFRHACSAPCALALATALATTPVAAAPTERDTIRTKTDSTDCVRFAPSHGEGFFLAMPAHLYGDLSTFGLHAGWQFPSFQMRLDLSVAERKRERNSGEVGSPHWRTTSIGRPAQGPS